MLQLCSIKDCKTKHLAKGFCSKHYRMLRRGSDPHKPSRRDAKQLVDNGDYVSIKLGGNNNLFAKVDKGSEALSHNWSSGNGYAVTRVNGKLVRMHRFLTNASAGQEVDHINQEPLDNRLCNLRFVTRSLNNLNRTVKRNKSGHSGVRWDRHRKTWEVTGAINSKRYFIKRTKDFEEAIKSRREWEIEYSAIPV